MTDHPRPGGHTRSLLASAVVVLACVGLLVGLAGPTLGQSEATAAVFEASPDLVQADEDVTITYTADGADVTDEDVTLVITHTSGDERTFDGIAGTDVEQEIELNAADLRPGPYNVTVRIDGGPSGTLEDAFEVASTYDPTDANFGPTASTAPDEPALYRGVAGDFVSISVSLNELDEAYVLIGGDKAADESGFIQPVDILHVSGSTEILINTRLVGTDRPSEEVYIAQGGSVTSYAHDLGAGAEPTGPFEDIRFETEEYEQVAGTLAEFRATLGMTPQIRPIQPERYSLVVGGGDSIIVNEDGIPDPRFPLDRARIELTKPELRNVTTYRLPTANADEVSFAREPSQIQELTPQGITGLAGRAIETDTLAVGDRLLVEFNATGMYGALIDSVGGPSMVTGGELGLLNGSQFAELLDRPEGISLTLTHTNPAPNTEGKEIDITDANLDDVTIIPDPTLASQPTDVQTFYMVIDSRHPSPFQTELEGGEKFRIEMSYESPPDEWYRFQSTGLAEQPPPFAPANPTTNGIEHYPYFRESDTTETQSSSVTFEEKYVRYDRTTPKGKPVVTNTSIATISGTTNLAPGTNLPVSIIVDVRHEPITVEIEELTIQEDGSFSASTDLSMLDADDEVDIQFRAYQEVLDESELVVLDESEAGATFSVTDLSTESFARPNETIVDLSATVTNTGLLPGEKEVELLIDGEIVANRTVSLNASESRTFHFENQTADLGPGEYAIEVRTPDDRSGRLLIVEERDGVFEVESLTAEPIVEPEGTRVAFSTTVANTGTVNETGTIELLVDGQVVAERTPDLLAGQAITYGFNNTIGGIPPGEYVLTVRTPDDERSVEVLIEEPSASFEITEVDAPQTIQQGETLDVSATVTNTGNVATNGTVTFELANETVGNQTVELGAGNGTTVTFSTPVERAPGEYTMTFRTPDQERTFRLVVENGSTNGSDSTDEPGNETDTETDTGNGADTGDNDTQGPADESGTEGTGSGGFLGLGVASRAVLGGTAIVGAIHVLGYWV